MIVTTGILIGVIGFVVGTFTAFLTSYKFEYLKFTEESERPRVFFTFLAISLLYSFIAGLLCWIEPKAVGSGIPEIKAYLNGINLREYVRIRVLVTKVIGMCFSCASGLPLGKEGPMIHAGSIVGAAVSQGKVKVRSR